MDNLIDTFANRLAEALRVRNMKPIELAEKSKVDKAKISSYINGRYKANQNTLYTLATTLHVSPVWLMGYDVPMESKEQVKSLSKKISEIHGAVVFVYGTIPAGIPIECIEDIIDTEEVSVDMLKGGKQYFGLRIKGNSMEPEYLDGDTLILEKVDDCENGQDCVVMVNGQDGTFKRVFKNENGIILQPLNPTFSPMVYSNEDIEKLPIKIIGKVVELRRKK